MKAQRKIVEINDELCDGCGQCVPACAEGAIEIVDSKARLVQEMYCDGLGACIGDCPRGALTIVEREADPFDEEAVEAHLREGIEEATPQGATMACGCPSSLVQKLAPLSPSESSDSFLSHWPVQIRLVPPTAPFLRGADLLVVADCGPVAYPTFHKDFLKDKIVLLGCPKFDNAGEYVQKFVDIFRTAGIRSVTTVMMEVPCCSGLSMIVREAMEKAGRKIPSKEIVISTRGQLLKGEVGTGA